MNRSESKYFHTAERMDRALLALLEKKDFAYITVKEICEAAGVHRSTFYLHYETIADLLEECEAYMCRVCFERYDVDRAAFAEKLRSADVHDLVFISPEYMRPYFEFVRENRVLFRVAFSQPKALSMERTFEGLFQTVFSPVLDRFHIPGAEKQLTMRFYLSGLMGIVEAWIEGNCEMPAEEVIAVCMRCILPDGAP